MPLTKETNVRHVSCCQCGNHREHDTDSDIANEGIKRLRVYRSSLFNDPANQDECFNTRSEAGVLPPSMLQRTDLYYSKITEDYWSSLLIALISNGKMSRNGATDSFFTFCYLPMSACEIPPTYQIPDELDVRAWKTRRRSSIRSTTSAPSRRSSSPATPSST